MPQHFSERMINRQEELGHALCVGLDPNPDKIPDKFLSSGGSTSTVSSVLSWMKTVADETADYATLWKPQMAYYERHGASGIAMLFALLSHLKEKHPEIPIVLDGKRGDIDRTQQQYRQAMFAELLADATNVSPYMGEEPLVNMFDPEHPERGVITLVYTSNKGARQVQDVPVQDPESGLITPYWLFIAKKSIGWADEIGLKNLGFVMAAAHMKGDVVYSDHLRMCRDLDEGQVQYLVPGFGTQGGFVEEAIEAGWAGPGSLWMNASSSINNAENPREAARVLADQIGEAIAARRNPS